MRGPGRDEKAILKLARIARARVDEAQAHLADLEAARVSAETSIDWLSRAVGAEEAGVAASPAAMADLARFLEGADLKKKALAATRDRLAGEIVGARDALSDAFGELKKLEHLVEIKRRAMARDASKAEVEKAADVISFRRPA